MSRLTVTCVSGASDCRVGAVLASLPESFVLVDGGADVAEIHGVAGWASAVRAALADGVRGVMVADPTPEPVADLAAEVERAGVPVVVDTGWAGNPAVATAAEACEAMNNADGLFRCRMDAPLDSDLDDLLLAQLALVRAVVGPVSGLAVVRRDARGYDILGTVPSGARIALSAALSNALPRAAVLDVVAPEDAVELTVPDPETAAPASVRVSDAGGERLLPHRHESAHRAAWRRLHALVVDGRPCTDLADLAADLAVIEGAARPAP